MTIMTMTTEELQEKLAAHKRWLETRNGDKVEGARLNLTGADLTSADLTGADLTRADLTRADLTRANLTDADLTDADLTDADLTGADLTGANLTRADLTRADLTSADLTDADLDYSAWPLWCCSLNVKIDKRLAAQLLYHALRAMQSCADAPDVAAVLASDANIRLANQFHRAAECGPLHAVPAPGRTDTTEAGQCPN